MEREFLNREQDMEEGRCLAATILAPHMLPAAGSGGGVAGEREGEEVYFGLQRLAFPPVLPLKGGTNYLKYRYWAHMFTFLDSPGNL